MKKLVSDWLIQLVWFVAGIFATGAFWYFLSKGDWAPTILSAVGAAGFAAVAIALHRLNDRDRRFRNQREAIAEFVQEGHSFVRRLDEDPLPAEECNEWIERVDKFLAKELDQSFVVRFNDFTGFTFYSDGSEKSRARNNIDGRLRRLNEFLSELSQRA